MAQVVTSLLSSSNAAVPMHRSSFFKFWWDEKLDELKTKSIASCRIIFLWKTAGKPRSGPIFDLHRKDRYRYAYKHEIRERRLDENRIYTNDLHEALMEKHGTAFCKCCRSKLEPNKNGRSVRLTALMIPAILLNILHHILKEYTPTALNWGQPD